MKARSKGKAAAAGGVACRSEQGRLGGVLIVGTRATVAAWAAAMGAMEPRVAVDGCLLPETELAASGGGCRDAQQVQRVTIRGGWDALRQVVASGQTRMVLVSLPERMRQQLDALTDELERSGAAWRNLPALADQLWGDDVAAGEAGELSETKAAAKRGAVRAATGLYLSSDAGGLEGGGLHVSSGPVTSASTLSVLDPARLIARQPRALDLGAIEQTLAGKVVLITGSGGSIGSEIARRVAAFGPAKLVLAERSENALFDINRQIARLAPSLDRVAALHDVTNASRTRKLLETYRPAVIFHAAAHKHVPMMEDHPADAVENNFYGTRSVAMAADEMGVEKFVMISSDKAVNPSSVMGATKRLAELFIQHLNTKSNTTYSMVRFGNVLGSACSVIPIWTQQLAHGGPITVTSPEMVRYFMTIPEAAGLVLQSAALSGEAGQAAGEVFLLDMGKPVRILDLARRFLQVQGLEPDVDIPIQITGVRPGEKLFEELAYSGEDMLPTSHPSVHLWRSTHCPDDARMKEIVSLMDSLRAHGADEHPWQHATTGAIHQALRLAVPEFVSPNPPRAEVLGRVG